MNRRTIMTLLGGAAAWPLAARAQQGERMRRIGVLMTLAADDPQAQAYVAAFQQALSLSKTALAGCAETLAVRALPPRPRRTHVAHPSLPVKSLADVIALAKKEPGKLTAGTPPPPTISYLAAELFRSITGAEIMIVLYKGTGPLTNDLVGGHVAVGFNTIPPARSNIEAGNLHAITVAGHARSAALPDIPTAAESGLPGFEATLYYGLSAPAGTPRPIIERFNSELRSMIESEEMRNRIVADGGDPIASTPEEYAANIEREEGKWAALIKKLGLKIE